jgi:dihydroorotate dehydrogenase
MRMAFFREGGKIPTDKEGTDLPDWSYRTLFRPLLFALPSRTARAAALAPMGTLSRIPGGTLVIKTLGHMERYRELETGRLTVPTRFPVGLGGALDIHGYATAALAQFGFGYVEVGPVTPQPLRSGIEIVRDAGREELIYPLRHENDGLERVVVRERKLARRSREQPRLFRLRHMPGATPHEALAQWRTMAEATRKLADGYLLDVYDDSWTDADNRDFLEQVAEEIRRIAPGKPLFLYVPLDMPDERFARWLNAYRDRVVWDGMAIGDTAARERGFVVGKSGKELCLAKIRLIRERGLTLPVIAGGGVHEPQDALDLVRAGADFVQVHSGMVFHGPGLPKRVNEAILHEKLREEPAPALPSFWSGWGWMVLLGIGMIVGGLIAFVIAATTVMLPYDEAFLGADRHELHHGNGYVLPFMSHDRITLAGTMVSIGILYAGLGGFGLRRGLHWAKTAAAVSGVVGFSSFFLYLGYGYFDPLHALAAAILLPMFVLALRRPADESPRTPANLRNDRVWVTAQWGQLMLVALGVALAVGGTVISLVGITHVFVPQDLDYLRSTPEELSRLNPRLLPLIAHDRAGFGGALLSDALALLGAALWGIRQGERWLWWTIALGGLPGFAAGFGVHLAIGYRDFVHLLPAYAAFALYVAGIVLLYPYMMRKKPINCAILQSRS